MSEAELTAGIDASRIGWVQVGLEVGDVEPARVPSVPVQGYGYAPLGVRRQAVEPAVLLPALIQCFHDALRRFGVVELSGLQVTANLLEPRTQSYAGFEVQFYTPTPDGWVELPTDDIGIIFDGSSATVSGLPDDEFYYFRVRAEWSEWPPGFLTLENPYH